MNKALLLVAAALVVSLGVNAWQFAQANRAQAPIRSQEQSGKSAGGRPETPQAGSNSATTESKAGRRESGTGADGPGTLGEILAIRDPLDRYEALLPFVRNLPAGQIGEVLKELRAGSSKLDAEGKLIAHLLLSRWGVEDPDAAFVGLNDLSAKQGGGDAMTILAALAATDPARAVAWLRDPNNRMTQQPRMGHMLARTIAEQWARQDPDAALAWATGLPDDQRVGAYAGIISNILETDPARAAAMALELPPADRPKLLGEIAETWARQSPEAAVAWANTLDPAERADALSEALGGWAATVPAAAANFLNSMPEQERGEHVFDLARTWAQQAPAEAADWLGSQPESDGKVNAMGHVMWNWTSADPAAAANWLGDQPAGRSYDNGVAGLAKAAAHAYDDGETAVVWSSTIENEQLRETMTRHTLGQWMRQDLEAAQAWAAENGIEAPASRSGGGK